MKPVLDEPDSRALRCPRSITASISRRPTPVFWPRGVDRDRPDARDRVALVEEVRAHDPPVNLRHDTPHLRVRIHAPIIIAAAS